jgi:hypothetical protein
MKAMRSSFWLVMWVLFSLCAVAETPDPKREEALQNVSAPDAKATGVGTFSNAASIQAGTADSKGSLSIAGWLPFVPPHGNYLHYSLHGEAPISTKGSTDEVDIGTVSGLTAGASASAEVSAIRWPTLPVAVPKMLSALCKSELPNLIPGFSFDEATVWSDIGETCSRALFTKEELQAIVDGLKAHAKKCDDYKEPPAPLEQQNCARLKAQKVIKPSPLASNAAYLRRILAQVDEIERQQSRIYMLTFGTTVNRQKVTYFNKNDLATLVKDHVTGYGAHVAYTTIRGNLFYSAGFSYEKTYKNADTSQICSPVTGSTSLKCSDGGIGAPTHTFSRIIFSEARYLIITGALAIAPRVEYDFTSSKFAAKLPIYLAPNKDKVLSGGVTLGYVTHGDGFGAAVFVNKTFSFF